MKNLKKSLFLVTFLLFVTPAFALGSSHGIDVGGKTPPAPLTSIELPNPLVKGTTIETIFSRIVGALRVVIPSIAAGIIVYAAFQILTAQGDSTKFGTAKKTIGYAVLGLVLFLVADLIIGVITEFIGKK